MKLSKYACRTVGSFLLFLAGSVCIFGQYPDRPPDIPTTDDPRRVPIPPRDRSADPILVLKGGTLIDGTGAEPIANGVLVIQGDRILDVGGAERVSIPERVDRVIDITGLYAVPGLIDLHIHFTQQRGEDFARYRDSDAAAAIRGVKLLEQLLDGGITTVRSVGTNNDLTLKLKEAVERRILDGPRIFWSAKRIASRAGHLDEATSTGSGRPRSLNNSSWVRVATGPWDWRLAVREQIRMQADLIKMTSPYTRAEVAAAIDEAHLHGFRVTVDAFEHFVTWAVEAGVDSVEHPLAISDQTIELMAMKGTGFVPTITAFYNVLTHGYPSAGVPAGGFYYTTSRRFHVSHHKHMETVRKALESGVKMGIGTDIPFENEKRYPNDYFTEMKFFKDAGFSNQQILESASRVGAEILGMSDKLGTLEKGKLADVLVVAANPLADIQNIRQQRLVIADGRVVRNKLTADATGRER